MIRLGLMNNPGYDAGAGRLEIESTVMIAGISLAERHFVFNL